MRINAISVCGCLVLAGCGPATPAATEADVAKEVFGSTENLNAMKAAAKVTACRISKPPEDAVGHDTSWDQALTLYKEGEWVELSGSQVEQTREVLKSPRTYWFDVSKECIPHYGVRVRFDDDGETIDVNLCFECKMLAVVRDGKIVGREDDFDGGASKLTAICKELFPDEPEIQALKP